MKPTYEQLERERNELTALNKQLRETVELIAKWNSHTNELAVNYGSNGVRDFYRRIAESSLSEQPSAALAALKAQWQAEVVDRCEKEVTTSVNVLLKPHIAGVFAVIRQRAQEEL